MKKRFTEEQIIQILGEGQAGTQVADICRKYGISHPTYYLWKSKYSNMTVSEAKRLILGTDHFTFQILCTNIP